jgi:hypothetical protein
MDLPIDDNNNHHLISRPSQSIYIYTNESGNKKYAAAGYGPVRANPFDKTIRTGPVFLTRGKKRKKKEKLLKKEKHTCVMGWLMWPSS